MPFCRAFLVSCAAYRKRKTGLFALPMLYSIRAFGWECPSKAFEGSGARAGLTTGGSPGRGILLMGNHITTHE